MSTARSPLVAIVVAALACGEPTEGISGADARGVSPPDASSGDVDAREPRDARTDADPPGTDAADASAPDTADSGVDAGGSLGVPPLDKALCFDHLFQFEGTVDGLEFNSGESNGRLGTLIRDPTTPFRSLWWNMPDAWMDLRADGTTTVGTSTPVEIHLLPGAFAKGEPEWLCQPDAPMTRTATGVGVDLDRIRRLGTCEDAPVVEGSLTGCRRGFGQQCPDASGRDSTLASSVEGSEFRYRGDLEFHAGWSTIDGVRTDYITIFYDDAEDYLAIENGRGFWVRTSTRGGIHREVFCVGGITRDGFGADDNIMFEASELRRLPRCASVEPSVGSARGCGVF